MLICFALLLFMMTTYPKHTVFFPLHVSVYFLSFPFCCMNVQKKKTKQNRKTKQKPFDLMNNKWKIGRILKNQLFHVENSAEGDATAFWRRALFFFPFCFFFFFFAVRLILKSLFVSNSSSQGRWSISGERERRRENAASTIASILSLLVSMLLEMRLQQSVHPRKEERGI